MTSAPLIRRPDDLHTYLYTAMMLEHGTIPPYLTALYSIHPSTNLDASQVLRVIAVEEMLHLTLVANIYNAVGGRPDLTRPDFVPEYPAYLPDGEDDFQVHRERFSPDAVRTFLDIERPDGAPDEGARVSEGRAQHLLTATGHANMRFYSIGDFYEEIRRGIEYLHGEYAARGDNLFSGDPSRQVTSEYYYSGGAEIIPVTDLESAAEAIRIISEQGEGLGGAIFSNEGEIAHYYRFMQLQKGRFYHKGDHPDRPTGPPVHVDWDAVYPIKRNVTIADYPEGSELREVALDFNRRYADFLALLTRAYTGHPELLIDAVVEMFSLKEAMIALIRNPIPGGNGEHGGPTFEMSTVVAAVGS